MFFNRSTLDLTQVRQLIRDSKIPLSEIREVDLLRQFIICYPLFNQKSVNFFGDAGYLRLLVDNFGQIKERKPYDLFCIYFSSYPEDFNQKVRDFLEIAAKSLKKSGRGVIILPKRRLKKNLISLIEMQAFLQSLNLKIYDFDGRDVSQEYLVIQMMKGPP